MEMVPDSLGCTRYSISQTKINQVEVYISKRGSLYKGLTGRMKSIG